MCKFSAMQLSGAGSNSQRLLGILFWLRWMMVLGGSEGLEARAWWMARPDAGFRG